ncbi:MAG: glycosyltransferase family 2 protein [Paludibacteraceae bacterium]|nr:glycosyltransferase family 2 protein [Paludibacteraceae bacterium]
MKKITVLVPCYNEQQVLPLFLEKIQPLFADERYAWELLLIDDGSDDQTLSVMQQAHARDARINYIELSRNFGKESALLAGLDYVTGDAVVIMDADLQHPVSVIPDLLLKWEKGYDDVYARRISRGKESWVRKILTKWYYALLQASSETNVYPNVGDFRLLDRSCIDALCAMRETDRYTKGMYAYIGFRKTFVDFVQDERAAGVSKWNFWQLMRLGVDGILSSSIKPLQIATKIGAVVSFAAFVYMIYVFFKALIYDDPVRGFPTLIIVILFLGGLQLLSIGLLGEYLGRIFHEAKRRPSYFIRTYNGEKSHK